MQEDLLYLDPEARLYKLLDFNKGFGPGMDINPYLKLVPMMAGIGSPGTLGDVSVHTCTRPVS